MKKLYSKIYIEGIFECITGLHIGDSKDNVSIGGVDGPVVRRKDNNEPYIPGSSIKGKMRSLLQVACDEEGFEMGNNKQISELFGGVDSKKKKQNGDPIHPTQVSRIIVRDAYLTRELDKNGELSGGSAYELKNSKFTDMPYTEQKYENVIDRYSGAVKKGGIRNQERVPAGAKFKVEFVINIYVNDDNEAQSLKTKYLSLFNLGMELLQNDYLGGSGTRGYGQIEYTEIGIEERTIKKYQEKADELMKKHLKKLNN